ncbi:hypothetical protein LX32DRAFT_162925 [Colletotrichum zoysiae]|uniref:Uncharacterized protein n=1 Tax=Colletotrichum zoysiae TaxID=1216348 RepID=A0AAD9H6P5_9PEZI|nr:hypothetical protein LX32DRAFT_162925 [Colletotrichum zoysiae]
MRDCRQEKGRGSQGPHYGRAELSNVCTTYVCMYVCMYMPSSTPCIRRRDNTHWEWHHFAHDLLLGQETLRPLPPFGEIARTELPMALSKTGQMLPTHTTLPATDGADSMRGGRQDMGRAWILKKIPAPIRPRRQRVPPPPPRCCRRLVYQERRKRKENGFDVTCAGKCRPAPAACFPAPFGPQCGQGWTR